MDSSKAVKNLKKLFSETTKAWVAKWQSDKQKKQTIDFYEEPDWSTLVEDEQIKVNKNKFDFTIVEKDYTIWAG